MSNDAKLKSARRSYQNAKQVGNRQEEARWANVIANIFKDRGEYVQSLKWLRIDYEISSKYLPQKQMLATCQSLGEVHLRLGNFNDALIYQKKHLDIAKDSSDLIEQQRASTQLGRTYHEMFLQSESDQHLAHNAKKYFNSSMKLVQSLKQNPPTNKSSFIKEYIDAHNNIGMLEIDLDNLDEAKKVLTKGLEICDEEEVSEDDGRSRLHHNLGIVFIELREWIEARTHIEKDIMICKKIGHCQGEAKGYISLGELHYRAQKYEEAMLCYRRALDLAKSMEDEDALVEQANDNIKIVNKAIKLFDELKKEEQNLKKLGRNMVNARGTPIERKCLLQQLALLDRLIEKSRLIFAWSKHCEFAKRKKRVASDLYDKEKLSDSFLAIGESYQKLRNFKKAFKWFMKSWEIYKSICNLEGQALAKINIGTVLDCDGDWNGALHAFEEGYSIALEAGLTSVQLSALENMHYSHMIRFDNREEARRLQLEIEKLKQLNCQDTHASNSEKDFCSETDTECDNHPSDNGRTYATCSLETTSIEAVREIHPAKVSSSTNSMEVLPKSVSEEYCKERKSVGRKRVRIVLSDDEGEMNDEEIYLRESSCRMTTEDVATSDEYKLKNNSVSPACRSHDISGVISKHTGSSAHNINVEESTCSLKSRSSKVATPIKNTGLRLELQYADDHDEKCLTFSIDNELVHVKMDSFFSGDKLSMGSLKVELACLYYLQLPAEKRSKGLLPIIHHMEYGGIVTESPEAFEKLKDRLGNTLVEVFVDGWVQKRLMNLYIDCCEELSEAPNIKLLKKLCISEVEDEVIASECELQDISIAPLLNALHAHKTVAMLDLSHNLLGNGTMEKLQHLFKSGQKYGDLTLDLHCNRFGPTALFQICECPTLFTRLEVLNISGNRLTDACGSYIAAILENCKALYSLNIEHCSVTSRTIQKISDSLDSGSALAQLCIGYNNPISGNSLLNLLGKLATLKSFAELSLGGLKLSMPTVDSICQLAKTSCLSGLILAYTGIGTDVAFQLTESVFSHAQDSVKLNFSHCGLTSAYIHKLNADVNFISGIVELNLGGNTIMEEGAKAAIPLLHNPKCCLRVLVLNKCQLGLMGILQLVQALAENDSLEELNLADNNNSDKHNSLILYDSSTKEMTNQDQSESLKLAAAVVGTDCNELEVADSEDDVIRAGVEESCTNTSSCQRNSSSPCKYVEELSIGIGLANKLQLLDLSNNSFSEEGAEALYSAWSSTPRVGLAWKHLQDGVFHLSTDANKCCQVKPCCRRV